MTDDASGNRIGLWFAKGLANPQGIATNGTDIWIVDAKTDRVYLYANAASAGMYAQRNPTSSFPLTSGNKNPTGITTDGNSLWVVNASTKDKVFKYTTNGTAVGNWTIDSANSNPTGITIDPNHVNDIWIVDSGSDAVYQYLGAANRKSGSQSAGMVFNLATTNSNPQGIADPPPVSSSRSATPLSAVQTASAIIPPADGDQKKSSIRSDINDVRFDLHSTPCHEKDQRQQSETLVHAGRSSVSGNSDLEDDFYFDDSIEFIDDALLSLLSRR